MKSTIIRRTLTEEDINSVNLKFKNLNVLGVDYFRKSNEIVFLHSAPFVDQDAYPFFLETLNAYKNQYVDVIGMPLIIGAEYLRIYDMPTSFDEFNDAMIETELVYTGGVGFTDTMEMQFISCADTEIVVLNLPDCDVSSKSAKFFSSRISESEAKKLVEDHKLFLRSAK